MERLGLCQNHVISSEVSLLAECPPAKILLVAVLEAFIEAELWPPPQLLLSLYAGSIPRRHDFNPPNVKNRGVACRKAPSIQCCLNDYIIQRQRLQSQSGCTGS